MDWVITRSEQLEDLKIEALSRGCRVTERALIELGGASALTRHEYATTGGIPCRVGDVYLNIPFDEWFVSNSPLVFDIDDLGPVLQHRGLAFRVDDVLPLPGYVGRPTSTGQPLDDIVFSHMDRARVSPITGCAYDCAFCDLPGRIVLRPLHVLTEAIRTALDDMTLPVTHLLISGGSPGPRQRETFADTLVGLIEEFRDEVPVDVMMSTGPETPALVERLVAAGVHGLSLNIEAFSAAGSEEHLPAKHRRARPHFDETVTTAVSLLGRGRVRSLIIPGLEPTEATIAGVQHLASLGADPVLSPFRPAQGTRLADRQPVSPADLRAVLDASRSIVAEAGVRLGPRCIPCQHNTLTFPWDVP
jgi:hypothetical protein